MLGWGGWEAEHSGKEMQKKASPAKQRRATKKSACLAREVGEVAASPRGKTSQGAS